VEEETVSLGLSKHEGAGNDFLIMIDLEERVQLTAQEVRLLADRHHGLGADGVITLAGPSGGGDLTMTLHNSDGSLAEISGNGVRCAAHAAVRAGLVASGAIAIMTGSGLRAVTCADPEGTTAETSVDMGDVVVEALDLDMRTATVMVGNPHRVQIVDELGSIDLEGTGKALQAMRPGGINCEWVEVHNQESIALVVYERGVGPTFACGSGSVASVGATRALGLTGDTVKVANPGGVLDVSFDGDRARLSGPVQFLGDLLVPLTRVQ